jgi:hypothetical protein
MWLTRRVKRTRRGDFTVKLPDHERELLASLPAQLRELLDSDDPATERLFPPAYAADPERDEDYQRLMHDDLVAHRRTALDVMEATLDQERLSEEELSAWLSALNDLRLVLGTKLDVSEDMYEEGMPPDDPRAPAFALYGYLGWLQEQVVDALAAGLPDQGAE